MEVPAKRLGKTGRRLLKAAAACALALAVFVVALPFLLPYIPLPALEFDVSPYLTEKNAKLFDCHKATARLKIGHGASGGYSVHAEGQILDWPFTATANVRFGFFRAKGDLSLELDGCDARLAANFEAGSGKDWWFSAFVPETRFSQDDAILGRLLPRLGVPAVSNMVCSGSLSISAEGSCTPARPVPSWSVRGTVKGVDAQLAAGGGPVTVTNLRMSFGADGIANHRDIAPMHPRADSVEAAGVVMSNVFASVRATDRSWLVTEAGADCAGGELKLYALFLDPKSLSTGATIFVDGVDAGKVLAHVSGFRGEASGRLHGKLPFFLKDGKQIRLRNAYLFSTPGETGKLRVSDARPILDNLASGGVPKDMRDNLSKALANLDYSVLRIELRRDDGDNDSSSLSLALKGSATHGKTTVPVDLNVTFRGDFEQLVNTGMRLSRRQ